MMHLLWSARSTDSDLYVNIRQWTIADSICSLSASVAALWQKSVSIVIAVNAVD